MAYYTQGEYETDVEWLEQRKAKLRTIFAVGQDRANNVPSEWRIDGLEYLKLVMEIEGEIEYLKKRVKYARVLRAQDNIRRMKKSYEGKKEIWSDLGDEGLARKFAQTGFDVRFIGTKWQVRSK